MKILLVCANPMNKSSSTRAFYTYFGHEKIELAQIYTNDQKIDTEACPNFYNITDATILKRLLKNKNAKSNNVRTTNSDCETKKNGKLLNLLKKIGKKEWPIIQLLRKSLWKQKRWLQEDLIEWAKDYDPDLIFYHNSNAFFLGDIAFTLANLLNKKIVIEVSDDYYFNSHFSLSPFYYIYRSKYKKHFENNIKKADGIIYISEKMKNKYDREFSVTGEVIHISSQLESIKITNEIVPNKINYFGNIGLGRHKTLKQVGKQLYKSHNEYSIDVYCPAIGNSVIKKLTHAKNVKYAGSLNYEQVIEKMVNSKYLLLVESFSKRNLIDIRYSLSTKVADYLYSGVPILAIGPSESGTIQYLKENNLAFVISRPTEFLNMLNNITEQEKKLVISNCYKIANSEFSQTKNLIKSFKYLQKILVSN